MAGCVYPELPMLFPYPCASRNEERELGRRGVVGLDGGLGREVDRGATSMTVIYLEVGNAIFQVLEGKQ